MARTPNDEVIGNINVHNNNDSKLLVCESYHTKARVYIEPGSKYPSKRKSEKFW